MTTAWIYLDTKAVGDVDHLKVFTNADAADEWFKVTIPRCCFEVKRYPSAAEARTSPRLAL
jgi:hypothetical protein